MKQVISTERAPRVIGPYSQAISVAKLVFCSGQIAINPATNQLENHNFEAEVEQVLKNLKAVCLAAGGDIHHIVKLTIYLTNLKDHYGILGEFMEQYFSKPYPARTVIQVSTLPKEASIEVDAIMCLE